MATKSIENLNHCNSDGYTPLHLACMKDKPDCVKALLLAGADVNTRQNTSIANRLNAPRSRTIQDGNVTTENGTQVVRSFPGSVADFLQTNQNKLFTGDMKYGGTPLHWSSSREVLDALIARDCDVNALNFNQQTALHVMVDRNRLECVVCLLSHEAEIDFKDKDGKTALHLAVEKNNIAIVQALVVFGCKYFFFQMIDQSISINVFLIKGDINLPNHDGKTPRHMVGKDASGSNEDMILYILHSVSFNFDYILYYKVLHIYMYFR